MSTVVRSVVFLLVALPVSSRGGEADSPCHTSLPPNLRVERLVHRDVPSLLTKSPTLQRQCEAIAAAPRVRVVITTGGAEPPGRWRARALFERHASGRMEVTIELPHVHDRVELLAHELEHVVEQLEGLDLAALARSPHGGVTESAPGVYETDRARAAGIAASREVHSGTDPAVEAIGRAGRALTGIESPPGRAQRKESAGREP